MASAPDQESPQSGKDRAAKFTSVEKLKVYNGEGGGGGVWRTVQGAKDHYHLRQGGHQLNFYEAAIRS